MGAGQVEIVQGLLRGTGGPTLVSDKEGMRGGDSEADHLPGDAEAEGEHVLGAWLQPHHLGLVNGDVSTGGGTGHKVICVEILHLLHGPVGQLDEAPSPKVR